MTSETLSSFGAGASRPTGGLTGIANAANLCEPPEREMVSHWERASTEYGLTTQRVGNHGTGGSSNRPSQQEIRWVTGGDLTKYVESYGDELKQVPNTYGAFDNFVPYLSVVDGLVEDHYGYGIDGTAAERALRTLIDGGRYNSNRYNIIACGSYPWVLTGPEGVLLCSPTPIERTNDIARTVEANIGGKKIEIEEENPTVLRGLNRVATYLRGDTPNGVERANTLPNEATVSLETHVDTPTSTHYGGCDSHVFQTSSSENQIGIDRSDLLGLGTMTLTVESLPGWDADSSLTPPNGGTPVKIAYDSYPTLGDTYPEGIAIGYDFSWDTFSYSPEQIAVLKTYHLDVDQSEENLQISINRTHTRLKTTSPQYGE